MEKIRDKINYIYQHLFNMPVHPFFKDIIRVNDIANDYVEQQEVNIKHKLPYKNTPIPNELDKTLKYEEILTDDIINELYDKLKKNYNKKELFKIISNMTRYLIKTNVNNIDELLKKFNNESKDKINIAIIGTGPAGLLLGCYLDLYYNTGSFNTYPKVNIILFDNRIDKYKPGLRKPYTRQRPFSTTSPYLSLILSKIYTWDENNDYLYINLFVLEYLLFVRARKHHRLPMIYENYSWDEYKEIFKKGKIHAVFDCSGGRLETDVFSNIDSEWLNKIDKINRSINKQLMIIPQENIVHLVDYPKEKKFKKNHFYGSLTILNNNNELSYYNKYDIDINLVNDLLLLKSIKNKIYTYKNLIEILKNFKDDINRNFLYTVLIEKKDKYKNKLFTFDLWSVYIRHAIKPSEIVRIGNHTVLYIGAGDTIFHSHFITGAGLNRIINFAVKCAHLLIDLK